MYAIASRSLCRKSCSTRNHSLQYALRQRQRLQEFVQTSTYSTRRDQPSTQIDASLVKNAKGESQARETPSPGLDAATTARAHDVTSPDPQTARHEPYTAANDRAQAHTAWRPGHLPFAAVAGNDEQRVLADVLGGRGATGIFVTGGNDEDAHRSLAQLMSRTPEPASPEYTSGQSSSQCPEWFLRDNVVLAEDSAARLGAGPIKLIKGAGAELEIANGREGIQSLIDLFLDEYDAFDITENPTQKMDDKVGPFAIVPGSARSADEPASKLHSFISLSHFLEISLSIAAGLTTLPDDAAMEGHHKRTFLSLYSPHDGSTEFLNQVVHAVANSHGADFIRISAADLADLANDIPAWRADAFLPALSSIDYVANNALAEQQSEPKEKDDEGDDEEEGRMMTIQMPSNKFGFRLAASREPESIGWFMPHMRERVPHDTIKELGILLDAAQAKRAAASPAEQQGPEASPARTIICITDFAKLSAVPHGAMVMQALEQLVHLRRSERKQEIMIVGTSSSSEIAEKGRHDVQQDLNVGSEPTYYRALIVPPFQDAIVVTTDEDVTTSQSASRTGLQDDITDDSEEIAHRQDQESADDASAESQDVPEDSADIWEEADASNFLHTNSRHIRSMISQIRREQDVSELSVPLGLDADTVSLMEMDARLMSLTECHRLAILAVGSHLARSAAGPIHEDAIRLAMALTNANHFILMTTTAEYVDYDADDADAADFAPLKIEHDLSEIKAKCNRWEKRLMHCVISPDQLKTTFASVHTKPDTIEALRTLTSMSLMRPDSFSYGVLQSESIPGVLLYGPPGTGKTLLAKAVAKESGATMLVISASEVNNKYVGEGEKTVRAVFSLARKLSPCVVFIDEADSLFQSRGAWQSRAGSHDTMNQFLSEIEHFGGSSTSEGQDNVFLMIATNRPFDLDDAILRRVPRKLLVDLPSEEGRLRILQIHLGDETLHESVSVAELARRTPFYSGSDLKNLCVAAALACVRDENAAAKAAREGGDKHYRYPAKRTLLPQHFETAIGEISASVSDDMGSLAQIRKFDEKYGDRKGRREKSSLGFGQRRITDDMLRVRV